MSFTGEGIQQRKYFPGRNIQCYSFSGRGIHGKNASIFSLMAQVLLHHFILQELKLYSTESRSLRLVSSFLHHMASSLNLPRYIDYYEMDHPFLMSSFLSSSSSSSPSPRGERARGEEKMEVVGGDGEEEEDDKSLSPPNIMNHLYLLLAGKEPVSDALRCSATLTSYSQGPFPVLSPKVCIRTLIIIKVSHKKIT